MSSLDDETALRQAIAANPKDDLPRLVLADWYEENGQEKRGQLLRLTTELIRDTDSTDDPRWCEQRALQQPFNDEIRAAMPTRLGDIICGRIQNNPDKTVYDGITIRGVSAYMNLSQSEIQSLPDNFYVKGVLILYGSEIQSLPENLHVTNVLEISNTQIKSLPENLGIGGRLDCSRNQLSRKEAERMLTLPGLSPSAKEFGLRSLGYRDMLHLLDTPNPHVTATASTGHSGGIAH